ncbi:MAG: sulfite exporter TauE/SafE family protein [Spirochaetaceae bacterium]|nr:MAG: sulfite exporter TauE/SafE family protein [Spirochaetaceae bacterium]
MDYASVIILLGYAAWGAVVGAVVGFTAIGIGLLGTPGLIVLFGMDPVLAVGTMTVGGFVMMLSGSWQHYRAGNVVLPIALLFSATAMPLSYLTARHARAINSVVPLRTVMGVVILLSVTLLFYRYVVMRPRPRELEVRPWKLWLSPILGAALGVLIGSTSISGSILIIACILVLKLPSPNAVGITSAVATVSLLVASLAHMRHGNIAWSALTGLLPGVFAGAAIGAHFASRVPRQVLRIAILIILLAAGAMLILG